MQVSHTNPTGTVFLDIRQLRRVNLAVEETGVGDPDANCRIAVVVDVETTGLSREDKVIELALRRFRYDSYGRIVEIGKAWSWTEDPGEPLSDEIKRITGLNDLDLAGQKIDDKVATGILSSADLVIAHHAAFDRPMVEARFPSLPTLPWACSCNEIDWQEFGFEGRSLGWLCSQAGWFFDAHRAENDVDAVVELLRYKVPDGRSLMYELNNSAVSYSHLVEAIGSAFETKDALKGRGYRWNAEKRLWWREIFEDDLCAEQAWLALEVYASGKRAKAMGPRITQRIAYDRYR